ASKIPAELRYEGQPKELVAIWGKKGEELLDIASSPDGRLIAVGGSKQTRILDGGTGNEVTSLATAPPLAFSPDGRTLASQGSNSSIRLWETAGWKEQGTLQGHEAGVGAIVFSPDGKTLASGGGGDEVRLWDVATKQQRAILPGH